MERFLEPVRLLGVLRNGASLGRLCYSSYNQLVAYTPPEWAAGLSWKPTAYVQVGSGVCELWSHEELHHSNKKEQKKNPQERSSVLYNYLQAQGNS